MKQVLFKTAARAADSAAAYGFTAAARTFSGLEALKDIRRLPQYFSGSVVDGRKVMLNFSAEFKALAGAERRRLRWYFDQCGFRDASESMKGSRGYYQYKANNEADAQQIAKFHNDLLALARRAELSTDETVTTDAQYAASGQKITEGLVTFLRPYSAGAAQTVRAQQAAQSAHETQMQTEATERAQMAEIEEKSKASTATSKVLRYAAIGITAVALVVAVLVVVMKKKHK